MTYKLNGAELLIPPTAYGWMPRKQLGINGLKKLIYAPTYAFEYVWDALTPEQFAQLYNAWKAIESAGFVTIEIPKYNASTYVFETYTGVVIDEPSIGDKYFQGYQMQITMLARGIVLT